MTRWAPLWTHYIWQRGTGRNKPRRPLNTPSHLAPHGLKEFMDWKSPAIPICQYIYFHNGMAIPDIKRIMFFNSQHALMSNLQACIDWALVI
jgi:hypothetical protein